jgi:hypothetical protein
MKTWILGSLVGIMMGTIAFAQGTAGGTLTINGTITGSMTLTISTDSSGATISGSGSSAGTMNFGSVSASTSNGTVATGITKSTIGGGYQLSTVVDVVVTAANESSPNFALTAAIDNTDELLYLVNGVQMTTSPQVVGSAVPYSSIDAISIVITVPSTANSTSVNRFVTFTATAN